MIANDGGIYDEERELGRTHTKSSHLLVGSYNIFICWTARSSGHGPLLVMDKPLILGGCGTIAHQVDERVHRDVAVDSSIHLIDLHIVSSISSDAELRIYGHDPKVVHVWRPAWGKGRTCGASEC